MTENVLARQMRSVAVFANLSPEQLASIAGRAERRLYSEGNNLAVRGETSDGAIVIVDGAFACTDGFDKGRTFEEGAAGTVIGEMAMFIDDFEHPSTFVTTRRVKALYIRRADMHDLLLSDPDLAARLVDSVASRLVVMSTEMRRIEQIFQAKNAQPSAQRGAAVT